ncbi:MAG: hypothetical protein AAF718_08790 [Pseudomonadota bacterium]
MKTTVIARLYRDAGSAQGIFGRLYRLGFPRHMIAIVTPEDAADMAGLQIKIEQALVPSEAAAHYAARVAEGQSLVVVQATYKPLNAVRRATETFETSGAVPSGLAEDRFYVSLPLDPTPSILKDHPRFLTPAPGQANGAGLFSERFGLRLLSPRKRRDSAIMGGRTFFGKPLIVKKERRSILPPNSYMSRYFWPTPLLSNKPRRPSILPDGGTPLSRLLGWSTTS